MQSSGTNPNNEPTVSALELAGQEAQQKEYELNLQRSEEAIQEAEARDAELGRNPVEGQGVGLDQPEEEEDDKVDTIGEVVDELGRVVVGGGITRALESSITLPEKLIDIATGEYSREQLEGGYEADFMNPFKGYEPYG